MLSNWRAHFPYATPRDVQSELLDKLAEVWDKYDVFIIQAPTALGKCHAPGQGILMYDGTIRTIESIQVGDLLMGPDSLPRRVVNTYSGQSQMVTVIPKRGNSFTVTSNHVLPVITYSSTKKNNKKVHKLLNKKIIAGNWHSLSKTQKYCSKLWKPDYIQFPTPNEPISIPPYILGLWLGDGTSSCPALTTMDDDIAMNWIEWGESLGCTVRVAAKDNNESKVATYCLRTARGRPNPALTILRNLNLLRNKHIPNRYLLGSKQERLELLAGLSDTDGYWNTNSRNFEITQKNKTLTDQILFLMRSLGFAAEVSTKVIKGTTYYRITGSSIQAEELPVKCSRKCRPANSKSNQRHVGFRVEPNSVGQYYGIEVDGDHLYLLDNFIVTHNSSLARTLMSAVPNSSYITPTNILVNQFRDEFPEVNTLSRLDSYKCNQWRTTCSSVRGRKGGFCRGCPAGRDLSRAHYRSGTGVYNYHIYSAHKIYRDLLIVDEAHNTVPFIRDMMGLKFWRHDYNYPDNVYYNRHVVEWIESLPPQKRKGKRISKLYDIARTDPPYYIVQRTTDWFNGKGTRRGEPEERDVLKLLPVDISSAPKILWPSGVVKKIVLMSGTISTRDTEALGLPTNRTAVLQCRSPIPPAQRPIILDYQGTVNRNNLEEATRQLANYIDNTLLPRHRGEKGLVHATYQMASILRKYIVSDRIMWHTRENRSEMYEKFRKSPVSEGKVLVACGMYEGIDLSGDLGRWQVIAKIPWLNLGNPAIRHMANSDEDYYYWETLKVLIQSCGRICRTEEDYGATYILDGSFQRLLDNASHMIPEYFREALVEENRGGL